MQRIIYTNVLRMKIDDLREEPDKQRLKMDFFIFFPNVQDTLGIDDSRIDYARLVDCFISSKKLRTRRKLSWIVKHYDEIIAGKYEDGKIKTPADRQA